MSHSGDFTRWPHLGPIRPMDGGGHLGPFSYVYGYKGGVGRREVGQDTTGDDGIKIRAQVGRHELILWRCAAAFVPKSAILRFADVAWVNGKTADLADKIKSRRDAPGRAQVAYQAAGSNSGPLKNYLDSLVGLGGS